MRSSRSLLTAGLGGLALGLSQPAPRRAAAAGGAPHAGQQQPQPEEGHCPHSDAIQEHRARAGHVVAKNPGHADDDGGDQDDEPKNNDHDALRGLKSQAN
jgi:hypothetical protein